MTGTLDAGKRGSNELRMIVARTTEIAPLKAVATKAIQMAEDERAAAMDLATVLSSDQALTAKLLKLSNSAYYGYARRIANVREAVILLGMRTVRSVAIASSIIDAFETKPLDNFSRDLFWAHSVCVGLVAEQISKATRVGRPEDAFTAGVLHDVGKLAMMLCEPEKVERAARMVREEGRTWRDAEFEVLGVRHQEVGAHLAERWRFPEHLVEAIRMHHPARMTPSLESLNDVVAAANLACNREGLACGFDWKNTDGHRPLDALPPRVDEAIDRVNGGMQTLEAKARAFLGNVSARPPVWYASSLHDLEEGSDVGDNGSGEAKVA